MSLSLDGALSETGGVVLDASDFLSLPHPSSALSVNAAFAARFDAGAARAASQRKAALVASAIVPAHVLRAFTFAISKAAAATSASVVLPPEQIVADVFARHQLRAAEGAAPAVAAPRSAAAAAELERFLGAGPGRAAVAKLLRWARAAAYKSRTEQPPAVISDKTLGVGTGGEGGARRRKRADPDADVPEPPAAKSVLASAPAAAVALKGSAEAIAQPFCSTVIVAQPQVPAAAPLRGRGVGRGKGLLACGEPPFEELHPSWKAKRIREARQQKAVRRDLRADTSKA